MEDIKVSIIVPVYNVEAYIEKCLDSLTHQTLQEMEVIVVNDGSPDGSKDIVLKYQKKYPEKIRYLEKENGGLSDARNYGIPHAMGEYIAFLDSDDYIDLKMYEIMYRAAENGKKKVVECDFFWEYSEKSIWDKAPDYKSVKDYLVRGRVVAWNKLYRRDWLESVGMKFPKGLLYEDVEFFFSVMPHLESINELGVVRIPFVHYLQRSDSISYRESYRITDICAVYKNAIENLSKQNLFETYKEELEYKFVRNTLWGFPLKKARKIKDKYVKERVLSELWKETTAIFPQWKNNAYLKKKVLANIYLSVINERVFYILFKII